MTQEIGEHGWTWPEEDEENWHTTLENWAAVLDNEVWIIDTEANQSNYTPTNDAPFYAHDTNKLFLGNGSNWVEIADFGNIGSGSGGGGWTSRTTVVAADSPYDITDGESIWADTVDGNIDLNAPSRSNGVRCRIKHVTDGGSAGTCTFVREASENVDGAAEDFTIGAGTSEEFETDGSDWETH